MALLWKDLAYKIGQVNSSQKKFYMIDPSGLYYKHILTSVSDNRKWRLYYKCVIDDASLVS